MVKVATGPSNDSFPMAVAGRVGLEIDQVRLSMRLVRANAAIAARVVASLQDAANGERLGSALSRAAIGGCASGYRVAPRFHRGRPRLQRQHRDRDIGQGGR